MKIYNFSLKDLQFYLQGLPAHNTLKAAKVEDIRHCSHHLGNRKDYKTAVIDEATLTLILMLMMMMMMKAMAMVMPTTLTTMVMLMMMMTMAMTRLTTMLTRSCNNDYNHFG